MATHTGLRSMETALTATALGFRAAAHDHADDTIRASRVRFLVQHQASQGRIVGVLERALADRPAHGS